MGVDIGSRVIKYSLNFRHNFLFAGLCIDRHFLFLVQYLLILGIAIVLQLIQIGLLLRECCCIFNVVLQYLVSVSFFNYFSFFKFRTWLTKCAWFEMKISHLAVMT